VTLVVRYGGRTADGAFYDGVREVHPGDPQYDELLPIAQQNPQRRPPARPVSELPDKETLLKWFFGEGGE
jgi:hypothetical protein